MLSWSPAQAARLSEPGRGRRSLVERAGGPAEAEDLVAAQVD